MNGIIILSPHAQEIINRKKETEYRSKPCPKKYLGQEIYLLSEGQILGIIEFLVSKYVKRYDHYAWYVAVIKKFRKPQKYNHPNGAQVWVRNVNTVQTIL